MYNEAHWEYTVSVEFVQRKSSFSCDHADLCEIRNSTSSHNLKSEYRRHCILRKWREKKNA